MKFKKRYISLVVFFILLFLANIFVTLKESDKQIVEEFSNEGQSIVILRYTFQNISMRYIMDKEFVDKLPTIIFVHGAPGSSQDFYKYLHDENLREKANLISVDRLGYGDSNHGKSEVSISKQAEALNFIANKYCPKRTVLVGWSYGGPIIGKMAIEVNDFAHLFFLAPALSAKHEKHFWLGYFAKWPLTRWLVPKVFIIAEDEKLAHPTELAKLDKEWQKLKTPITYFHGTNDYLVPYENMEYFKSKKLNTKLECITIKGGDHFIPFSEYDNIKIKLLQILAQL